MTTLVLRCDASPRIGIGHLMRCLVLADAWPGRCVFAMRDATLGRERLARHELVLLPDDDPARVIALAERWVVVDHYELDERYLAALAGLRTLAIDDVAAHPFPVDVLVNPSGGSYVTAPQTRSLLGPRFALVRDAYRRARPASPNTQPLASVLVTFGGSDPDDRAFTVATALARSGLRIEVVLGPGYRGRLEATHGIVIHRDLEDLVVPMQTSQLMIGAGGSTAWEACCLGLPMILWPFADNQRGLAASLAEAGAAVVVGDAADVVAQVASAPLHRMARAAWELVDGAGAARIVEAMT